MAAGAIGAEPAVMGVVLSMTGRAVFAGARLQECRLTMAADAAQLNVHAGKKEAAAAFVIEGRRSPGAGVVAG